MLVLPAGRRQARGLREQPARPTRPPVPRFAAPAERKRGGGAEVGGAGPPPFGGQLVVAPHR